MILQIGDYVVVAEDDAVYEIMFAPRLIDSPQPLQLRNVETNEPKATRLPVRIYEAQELSDPHEILLFAYPHYYPNGGVLDYETSFNTIASAKAYFNDLYIEEHADLRGIMGAEICYISSVRPIKFTKLTVWDSARMSWIVKDFS